MVPEGQNHFGNTGEEVVAVIRTVHETEQGLRELPSDVNAVMSPGGYRRLMDQAQGRSFGSGTDERQLVAIQSGILNALPAHIALLNNQGVIVSVNHAWRRFADDNCLQLANHGLDLNYVDLCDKVVGSGSHEARQVAAGIRSVLRGAEKSFALDYPCHSQSERHWFRLLVTPLRDCGSAGVVVAHINITERKLIEEDVRRHAARLAALVEAQQELAVTPAVSERIMDHVAAMAQRLTGAEGAVFELIDGDKLVFRATSGIATKYPGLQLKRETNLTSVALRRNRTQLCDDAETDLRIDAAGLRESGARSLVVAVVRGKSGPVGTIKALACKPHCFGEHDAQSLELFAQSLGTFLQRIRAEEEFRVRALQQTAVAKLGQAALTDISLSELTDKAVAVVAETFGVEFSSVFQALPNGTSMRLVAGTGWFPGHVGSILLPKDRTTVPGYTMLSDGPVILNDLSIDDRFSGSPDLQRYGIVSGISVVIQGEKGQWGSLGAFTSKHRAFTPDDVSFVQAIANLIAETNRRRTAEEALRDSKALLQMAGESAGLGGWILELPARHMRWSDEVCAIHDMPAGSSPSVEEAVRYYAPGSREKISRLFIACIIDGKSFDEELQIISAKGRPLWVRAIGQAVRDTIGAITRVQGAFQDITRRVALEEQLNQSQRLEAVGQLTGGVAHDFNNLLTIIQGNCELLTEQLAGKEQLRLMAETTLSAAKRGAELTRRLLAFARRQALEPKVIDVNQLLVGMRPFLQRTLSGDITLVHAPHLWNALVDPSQLECAVLNLCINARDAMQGGGRLLIETANIVLNANDASREVDVIPGEYVMVAVIDTGIGISSENLDRVFDPFFTTKEVGKGTGLGLSMVYGFIKQSRGYIKISSEVGKGTIVKMLLPKSELACDVLEEAPNSMADLGGTQKILLVEDDELVRRHAESLLVALGYNVATAVDGPGALEIIRKIGDIDLLLTDVVMPGGINGRVLAEVALQVRPHIKVLYTSGYTEDLIIDGDRVDKGMHLLNKPYSRVELARKVRSALGVFPRQT